MKKFKLMDIESAFDFVNSGGFSDNSAVLNPKTGEIHWLGDAVDEDLPEDFDDDDDSLVWIPDKRDPALGTKLDMDFAREFCPEKIEEIQGIFSRRGAYASFKELLAGKNLLGKWYSFEEEKTRQALLDWCRVNNFEVELPMPGLPGNHLAKDTENAKEIE